MGQDDRDPGQDQHRSDRALHEVLDPGFQRGSLLAIERHQQIGRDRHALEPDPQVEQVAGGDQADHQAHHRQQHGIVFFLAHFFHHIRAGEQDDQRSQQQDTARHQQADPIDVQPDGLDVELARAEQEKITG